MKENQIIANIKHTASTPKGRAYIRKGGGFLYSLFRLFLLIAIGYIVLYPVLYMIITALRHPETHLDPGRVWIPPAVSLEGFKVAWQAMDFGKALWSTVRLQIVSAVLEVASCAFVAYGFARFKFKFKRIAVALLFVTILVPAPMFIIPLMTNFAKMDFLGILGLFNKLTGIDLRLNILGTPLNFYLPSLLAVGLRSGILIYIYIQFFKGLPKELEEAAWVDGAGPIRTFLSIALPSSSVVILTVTVFSLIWHWNDYYLSGMYMQQDYPLAVSLQALPENLTLLGHYIDPKMPQTMTYMMAACFLFITPMLIVYLILQRWFIESIDRVGITG